MKMLIVDYGLGNLWSVRNAFEAMDADVVTSGDPKELLSAGGLILPGVGSFGHGMKNIRARGLEDALMEAVLSKRVPVLGICLGMQLLADESEETPGVRGLGLIPGAVERIRGKQLRLPHMGFNSVVPVGDGFPLFEAGPSGVGDFYFVHSYRLVPREQAHELARTEYGETFASAVRREAIFGVQFHPEKSQSNGLRLIRRYIDFCVRASENG